jgi:hypothetical protein
MPHATSAFGWQEALAALAIVVIAAFLVTWLVTDRLHVRRPAYVAILGLVVVALSAGYLAWSGTSLSELVRARWGWGVVAGIVAAGVTAPLVRRLPARPHPAHPVGVRLGEAIVWEGIVYGFSEAVLLATLPVLAVWQAMDDRGWTGGGWEDAASGSLAIAGALLVILVHHLGYVEFRSRAARPKLFGALVTCGFQAVAFLATGSIVAPVVAHILLHGQMIFRGVQLPPAPTPNTAMGGVRTPFGPSFIQNLRRGFYDLGTDVLPAAPSPKRSLSWPSRSDTSQVDRSTSPWLRSTQQCVTGSSGLDRGSDRIPSAGL